MVHVVVVVSCRGCSHAIGLDILKGRLVVVTLAVVFGYAARVRIVEFEPSGSVSYRRGGVWCRYGLIYRVSARRVGV